jgi:subtilisin family serine protease
VIRAAVLAGALALALPSTATTARFAVGLERGASADAVATRLVAATGGRVSREHAALRALTVHAKSAAGVRAVRGVAYVEPLDAPRRLAFTPSDPLVGQQWYLSQIRAFDAWPQPPVFNGVRVAIIDSGLDGDHVEFAGRVAAARSFVGSRARTDQQGHGTFVAGIVAAAHDEVGIAGIAFPAQLVIAKVVGADPTITLDAEVRAIRWAVDRAGADVVNLSFAGVRDPLDPSRDTFSPLEASAVDYAVSRGAVVVAAVGNADETRRRPWPFAAYPAALPHVVGVSALSREGSVPLFSARDRIYNDLAAPGQGILSTFPRALSRPGCANVGYSDCAADTGAADRRAFRRPLLAAQQSADHCAGTGTGANLGGVFTFGGFGHLLDRLRLDGQPLAVIPQAGKLNRHAGASLDAAGALRPDDGAGQLGPRGQHLMAVDGDRLTKRRANGVFHLAHVGCDR